MTKTRMEAFSDGVVAILITIMVLEFTVPHGADWSALYPLLPKLLAYVMSFVFLGIYWTNHHHLIHVMREVSGAILWANLHLLFWLSLVPFATAWMGESHWAAIPTAVYGIVLLCDAIAYTILVRTIFAHEGVQSKLRAAIGNDTKGTVSLLCYVIAIPLAFVQPLLAQAIYVAVAISWLIPDRRIEGKIART
jgi:TMEM175 potassium channel family protein